MKRKNTLAMAVFLGAAISYFLAAIGILSYLISLYTDPFDMLGFDILQVLTWPSFWLFQSVDVATYWNPQAWGVLEVPAYYLSLLNIPSVLLWSIISFVVLQNKEAHDSIKKLTNYKSRVLLVQKVISVLSIASIPAAIFVGFLHGRVLRGLDYVFMALTDDRYFSKGPEMVAELQEIHSLVYFDAAENMLHYSQPLLLGAVICGLLLISVSFLRGFIKQSNTTRT